MIRVYRIQVSCIPRLLTSNLPFNMDPSVEKFDVESAHKNGGEEDVAAEAIVGDQIEHQMTFYQGLRLYPKSIGWSAFFSMGVIMTAFDPQLLGSLFATPSFQKDFGYFFEGSYIISAPWQTALGMGNPIGQVLGALAAGYPMEWYGRKPVGILETTPKCES